LGKPGGKRGTEGGVKRPQKREAGYCLSKEIQGKGEGLAQAEGRRENGGGAVWKKGRQSRRGRGGGVGGGLSCNENFRMCWDETGINLTEEKRYGKQERRGWRQGFRKKERGKTTRRSGGEMWYKPGFFAKKKVTQKGSSQLERGVGKKPVGKEGHNGKMGEGR